MSSENNRQFRMTLWPAVPLSLPRFFRREHCELVHDGRALIEWGTFEEVRRERGEIYLRLWQLDLSNVKDVVTFVSRYGSLSHGSINFQLKVPTIPVDPDVVRDVYERDPVVQALRQPDRVEEAGFVRVTPLADFLQGARFIRDITTAWWILNEDVRVLPPERIGWEYHDTGDPPGVSRDDALGVLHERFSPLLRRFTLTFEFRPESEEDQSAPVEGPIEISPTRGPDDSVQLHEICVLELFNHIAGGEFYRICESETCGQPFVRQYGRAEHGMSKREGVLYCTALCAQAQASRDYRRRKKQKVKNTEKVQKRRSGRADR